VRPHEQSDYLEIRPVFGGFKSVFGQVGHGRTRCRCPGSFRAQKADSFRKLVGVGLTGGPRPERIHKIGSAHQQWTSSSRPRQARRSFGHATSNQIIPFDRCQRWYRAKAGICFRDHAQAYKTAEESLGGLNLVTC